MTNILACTVARVDRLTFDPFMTLLLLVRARRVVRFLPCRDISNQHCSRSFFRSAVDDCPIHMQLELDLH